MITNRLKSRQETNQYIELHRMIAESDPKEKDIMINLVMNLLMM